MLRRERRRGRHREDPTDVGSHFHRAGASTDREAQYHPDSTGVYVRKVDGTAFSLTSIDVTMPGEEGGNFVVYGYTNAFDPDLVTSDVGADPDHGTVQPVAVFRFDNAAAASGTLNVAAENAAFNDISAFWIHLEGFPHSPTTNYITTPPPDFDLRVDNITLGAPSPVPVPAAAWLFGSGLAGLVARQPRRRA
ncbi:MAG: hypothetical protein HY943_20560 [Gammaproteobacteria bacterium]|nr:hypothetical protein [Gammaproteobacteria bacterium]